MRRASKTPKPVDLGGRLSKILKGGKVKASPVKGPKPPKIKAARTGRSKY